MTNDVAIKVDSVSKTFKLPHEKHSSVKSLFVNLFHGKRTYEKQRVLNNVSFEINKGEFFGIVGRNGSGKSTLLKLLAGIYTPDTGSIHVNGKLTPFIELGVGFNPELTGRENVFLNGALLGFNRKEMEAMYGEIVEFAELERFMDQKLKNYSSGMQVRLAFSIAIRANSEILLLDEVLAVGDEAFQKKCFNYFAQLKREKRTVILVSHDMESVKRFCNKALLLDMGQVITIDKSYKVSQLYMDLNQETGTYVNGKNGKKKQKPAFTDAHISTRLLNQDKSIKNAFNPEDKIMVELEVKALADLKDPVIGITIEKSNQETVFAVTTEHPEKELPVLLKKGTSIRLTCEINNMFGEDVYTVDSAIVTRDRTITYFREDGAATFKIQNWGTKGWLLHPGHSLTVRKIT